jgi:molecular chaperone GrpE
MLKNTTNIIKNLKNTYKKQEQQTNMKEDSQVNDVQKENQKEKTGANMIDIINDNSNPEVQIDVNEDNSSMEFDIKKFIEDHIQMQQQIEELTKERDDLKEQVIRKVAELENYRKRVIKEKEDLLDFANIGLIRKFLDLLDVLEKAHETTFTSAKDVDSIVKGMEMILVKFKKMMEEEGVSEIPTNVGDEFDVENHDAIMAMGSQLEAGKIAAVFQKGYSFKDRIVRHTKVATSKEKE